MLGDARRPVRSVQLSVQPAVVGPGVGPVDGDATLVGEAGRATRLHRADAALHVAVDRVPVLVGRPRRRAAARRR